MIYLTRQHTGGFYPSNLAPLYSDCVPPSLDLTSIQSDRLLRNSLKTARELKRARVHQVVEYEVRKCRDVRSIVVTEDVLLTDRVVGVGGLVLTYKQLQQLF